MKLKTLTSALLLSTTLLGANAMAISPQNQTAIEIPAQSIQLTQQWDKIFPKSDKVEHYKVTFNIATASPSPPIYSRSTLK